MCGTGSTPDRARTIRPGLRPEFHCAGADGDGPDLEAASVLAFAHLARELEAHGRRRPFRMPRAAPCATRSDMHASSARSPNVKAASFPSKSGGAVPGSVARRGGGRERRRGVRARDVWCGRCDDTGGACRGSQSALRHEAHRTRRSETRRTRVDGRALDRYAPRRRGPPAGRRGAKAGGAGAHRRSGREPEHDLGLPALELRAHGRYDAYSAS